MSRRDVKPVRIVPLSQRMLTARRPGMPRLRAPVLTASAGSLPRSI
jgi:hypothetical protein